MEKIFSLDNMSKNIFTESISTFREFPNTILSKNHNIYANAIKEAMAISDNIVKVNLEEAFKDSLYRIKETEKNISKNILFEDYAFNLKFVRPNISEINRPICVYHYKNLCNPDSPNLCKLNEYLDKFITVLSRFQSIGNPTDKEEFCKFLNKYSEKMMEDIHHIHKHILDLKDDEDSDDDNNFIEKSYYHFRDLDINPTGEEYNAGIPTRECVEYIKNEHLDIPTGVKGYNTELTSTINKINRVMSLLDSVYTDYDFSVKEAKKKFKHTLIVYASKYLSRANIAYSIKFINISEFLNPNNDSENKTELIEGCDVLGDILDNDVDDILMESFEDIISNETEVYRKPSYYTTKLMIMEAEFNGLLTQEIMNEADPPAQQPANGNTTSNPPATTGTETKDENGIINSAINKIKELWQIVRNFFLKLFGKMTTDANNISIKAQNINYQDIFKKYNGGQGFDPNVFPKLKGNNNYNTGIDNTLDFIKTKLPNISNNITNTLNFKDENATFTTEGFLQAIFGKPPQGDTSNLTVWAKNYFFGNDNLAQPDQEYQFGSGVSEEAFKKLQDFALEAGMNAKKLQDTQMEMCDKVSQYMINSINAVKHESDMIDASKYHIERVLEEYFGKDYDEIIQEARGMTGMTFQQQQNALSGGQQPIGKSEVNQGESEKKEEEKQQDQPKEQQQQQKPAEQQVADDPKAKEKEAKTTKIINASKSFSKVIETLTSAAGTAINIIGNDWIRIVNIINNYETNQQNQQSGEAKQNTNPPQQVEQQNKPQQQ